MKPLTKKEIREAQQRGYCDLFLIGYEASTYGTPYLYENKYPFYVDRKRKTIFLTCFPLDSIDDGRIDIEKAFKFLGEEWKEIDHIIVDSDIVYPDIILDEWGRQKKYEEDRNYHFHIPEIDLSLKGKIHKKTRYRLNDAKKKGYHIKIGHKFTTSHANIMASQILRQAEKLELHDVQAFVRLDNYIRKNPQVKLFNLYEKDELVGFDVLDFVGHKTMCTPWGFFLRKASSADFITYSELKWCKKHDIEYWDFGWVGNIEGLEEFKKKWGAKIRFIVRSQIYCRD